MSFGRYVLLFGVLFMGTFNLILNIALTISSYAARHPGEGLARSAATVLADMFSSGKFLTNVRMSYTLGFITGVYIWSLLYIGRRYFSRNPATDGPLRQSRRITRYHLRPPGASSRSALIRKLIRRAGRGDTDKPSAHLNDR